MGEQYNAEMDGLIVKAFAWHDKDDSGVLEPDEGVLLFSNFASCLVAAKCEESKLLREHYEEIAKQLVNLAVEKGGKSPDEAKKVVDQAWLYPHMEMAASMGEVFQAKL